MCYIIVTYEHYNDVQRTNGTNFTLIRQYAQVDVGGYSSICEDAFRNWKTNVTYMCQGCAVA